MPVISSEYDGSVWKRADGQWEWVVIGLDDGLTYTAGICATEEQAQTECDEAVVFRRQRYLDYLAQDPEMRAL